jgi:hypothetical protein
MLLSAFGTSEFPIHFSVSSPSLSVRAHMLVDQARGRSRWFDVAGIALAFAFGGCHEQAGSELIPVSGRVLLDDAPIGPGSLSLRPIAGTGTWDQPAGMIADDGAYQVFTNGKPGAPPGNYAVVVFIHEQPPADGSAHPGLPQSLIPARYNDPARSGLSLNIVPDALPDAYDLRLSADAD